MKFVSTRSRQLMRCYYCIQENSIRLYLAAAPFAESTLVYRDAWQMLGRCLEVALSYQAML
jgi:hypothetical protein